MDRSTAVNKIKRELGVKYGRDTLKSICEKEGWNFTRVSFALGDTDKSPIPKNLLEFSGLEVAEKTYKHKGR